MEVKINNTNPYGILTEERLIKFEKRLMVSLPSDYRNFLLQYKWRGTNSSRILDQRKLRWK
jgi:hypothetical protein